MYDLFQISTIVGHLLAKMAELALMELMNSRVSVGRATPETIAKRVRVFCHDVNSVANFFFLFSYFQLLTNVHLFRVPMAGHALMELTISHASAFQATPEINAKQVSCCIFVTILSIQTVISFRHRRMCIITL